MASFGTAVRPLLMASVFQDRVAQRRILITASIDESRRLAARRDYLPPRLQIGRVRVAGSDNLTEVGDSIEFNEQVLPT